MQSSAGVSSDLADCGVFSVLATRSEHTFWRPSVRFTKSEASLVSPLLELPISFVLHTIYAPNCRNWIMLPASPTAARASMWADSEQIKWFSIETMEET
jgi:hypothetical protein